MHQPVTTPDSVPAPYLGYPHRHLPPARLQTHIPTSHATVPDSHPLQPHSRASSRSRPARMKLQNSSTQADGAAGRRVSRGPAQCLASATPRLALVGADLAGSTPEMKLASARSCPLLAAERQRCQGGGAPCWGVALDSACFSVAIWHRQNHPCRNPRCRPYEYSYVRRSLACLLACLQPCCGMGLARTMTYSCRCRQVRQRANSREALEAWDNSDEATCPLPTRCGSPIRTNAVPSVQAALGKGENSPPPTVVRRWQARPEPSTDRPTSFVKTLPPPPPPPETGSGATYQMNRRGRPVRSSQVSLPRR